MPLVYIELRARNLSTLGYIDFATSHGRSEVNVNAVWLEFCAMTRPVSLTLETTDHIGIPSDQQDASDHTIGPAKPKSVWRTDTWDHYDLHI